MYELQCRKLTKHVLTSDYVFAFSTQLKKVKFFVLALRVFADFKFSVIFIGVFF